jgi:intein/homing endonuclease
MDNQQVTEFELGWLIGIIDGEGCYTLVRTTPNGNMKLTPAIKIVNTNDEIIEEICMILRKLGVAYYIYAAWRTGNRKPAKRIEILGFQRIKRFFDILYPRMICRAIQAGLLKEFVERRILKSSKEQYDTDEMSIYYALRRENKTGTSETTRETPD